MSEMRDINVQITIDAWQDTTWNNGVPGYSYRIAISSEFLPENAPLHGSVNNEFQLKTAASANAELQSRILGEVRKALNEVIFKARSQT